MHERMQTTMGANDVHARSQHQVKGVAENDLTAKRGEFLRRHGLDRAVSADRHERGRLDGPPGKGESPAARGAVAGQQFELHSVSPRPTSMASP